MTTLKEFLFGRKRNKPSPRSGYEFDDEDQEAATQSKRLRAEQRRTQAEIALTREQLKLEKEKTELALAQEKLKRYTEPDEEEQPVHSGKMDLSEMIFAGMMQGMMQGKQQQQQPVSWDNNIQMPGIPVQQVEKVQYTDVEIKKWISSMGKLKKAAAKRMDDNMLRKTIYAEQPNIHPETVERAIKIFRSTK